MNIGVLGGSFNPPHVGHILMAAYAMLSRKMDKVLVVPCFKHHFGKKLLDYKHRFRMCELAFKKFGDLVKVSDIEKRIGGISKTLITLNALSKTHKNDKFYLIVGSDILKEKSNWYKIRDLEKKYPMIVIQRGSRKEGFFIPNINSTDIRKRVAKGKDISGLVTRDVARYIRKKGIYKKL